MHQSLTDGCVFQQEGVVVVVVEDETQSDAPSDGLVLDWHRSVRSAQHHWCRVVVFFDGDVVAATVSHHNHFTSFFFVLSLYSNPLIIKPSSINYLLGLIVVNYESGGR